jgi:membrane-bound lytic murein transglycosylase D
MILPLTTYFATGLVLLVAALAFAALLRLSGALGPHRPEGWLRWGAALLALALLLPPLARLGGWGRAQRAPVELWTSAGATATRALAPPALNVQLAAAPGRAQWTVGGWAVRATLALVAGGMLAALACLAWRQRRLRRLCAGLPVIKAVGRVRLVAGPAGHDDDDDGGGPGVGTPFAARAGGLAYVVVPAPLVTDSARLRMVIAHEVHHHRRGDLHATWALALLRALFFWNPAVALWQRTLAELQDRCCDQQVLRRMGVSALEYGRCLLWVAEQARGPVYLPAGTRAMASPAASSLRRRLLMLPGPRRGLGPGGHLMAIASLLLVLGAAWVVHAAVADHRVTAAEVAAVAARVQQRSGFPLIADQRIVDNLNRKLANPNWRAVMQQGLARMPGHRPMIEEVLRQHQLPVELLAMVLHESKFDPNARTSRPPEVRAAGLWQFMPATARSYGLAVSPAVDERLDARKASEAAARYLSDLHARFGDWPLAVAAYNAGGPRIAALAAGVPASVAHDRLLASEAEYGRYLASFMVAVLLIEEPSLLRP